MTGRIARLEFGDGADWDGQNSQRYHEDRHDGRVPARESLNERYPSIARIWVEEEFRKVGFPSGSPRKKIGAIAQSDFYGTWECRAVWYSSEECMSSGVKERPRMEFLRNDLPRGEILSHLLIEAQLKLGRSRQCFSCLTGKDGVVAKDRRHELRWEAFEKKNQWAEVSLERTDG